jgi:hypothetical protein
MEYPKLTEAQITRMNNPASLWVRRSGFKHEHYLVRLNTREQAVYLANSLQLNDEYFKWYSITENGKKSFIFDKPWVFAYSSKSEIVLGSGNLYDIVLLDGHCIPKYTPFKEEFTKLLKEYNINVSNPKNILIRSNKLQEYIDENFDFYSDSVLNDEVYILKTDEETIYIVHQVFPPSIRDTFEDDEINECIFLNILCSKKEINYEEID